MTSITPTNQSPILLKSEHLRLAVDLHQSNFKLSDLNKLRDVQDGINTED